MKNIIVLLICIASIIYSIADRNIYFAVASFLIVYLIIPKSTVYAGNKKYTIYFVISILVPIVVITYGKIQNSTLRLISDGMSPTISKYEIVVANKIDNYSRGDIIYYTHNNETFISRIIGLPMEKIEFRSRSIYVNKEEIVELYKISQTDISQATYTVPINHYFVLGDKRDTAKDSRVNGYIDKNNILGKINTIDYKKMGRLKSLFYKVTGWILIISYFILPIILFRRTSQSRVYKMMLFVYISSFMVVIIAIALLDMGTIFFETLPYAMLLNLSLLLKSILISSPLSTIVLSLLSWLGGILSVKETYKLLAKR